MRLLFTGDTYMYDAGKVKLDKKLSELIRSCDHCITNLEGPITDVSAKSLPAKGGGRLKQPYGVTTWLNDNSFDILALANNHIMDYGKEGLHNTIKSLERKTLLGCGNWAEAYKPIIISDDEVKVGLLNVAEIQFGALSDTWGQTRDAEGFAWVNHPLVDATITELKSKVDCVVVIVHAGIEHLDIPLPEWRDRYRDLIDKGCDIVVGGHPHIRQGYENYKGKRIYYSLGNFCFRKSEIKKPAGWYEGLAVVLNINKGKIEYEQYGTKLINDVLFLENSDEFAKSMTYLNSLLDEKVYMSLVNKSCVQLLKSTYWESFNMSGLIHLDKNLPKSFARWLLHKYNEVNLCNCFQCESHRWCITRALKLTNHLI